MTHVIPTAALAQHIAVLGKNGSGKTYATKATIVEPLLASGKRVAIVDPTSAWWGLRSSADGKGPGFKVLVLGGDHGDLPLPALGGAAVARLIVEQGVNLVADTGAMTVGERTRWMIDFAGTLYRLNRAPLHLVIDEAHVFAPQGKVPDPDTGRMLHAVNQIAAGGRSRGIRLTMLTQRPQKLHKDALTTADTLIAMRVLAPQDRDAVKAWIDGCGDPAQGREVLASLANLKRGEGWVWYPEGGVLQRQQFPRITTFDSSATPKDGDAPVTPKGAAEIDLAEIKAALADAAHEAEANDPKRLKARIADLERQVKQQPTAGPSKAEFDAAYAAADREGYERGAAAGMRAAWQMHADAVKAALATIVQPDFGQPAPPHVPTVAVHAQRDVTPATRRALTEMASKAVHLHMPSEADRTFVTGRRVGQAADLSKAERLVLTVLAQYRQGRSRSQVAILTGYAQNGGGFNNALSSLRSKGLIAGSSELLAITGHGDAAIGDVPPLPTGRELLTQWLGQLSKAEKAALAALADAYPDALSKDVLARRAGYEPNGGGFNNALSRLRTLELISGRGEIRASEVFFE